MTTMTPQEIAAELATEPSYQSHGTRKVPRFTPESAAEYLIDTLPTDGAQRADDQPRRTAAIRALQPVADGYPTDSQLAAAFQGSAAVAAVVVGTAVALGAAVGARIGARLARHR